MSAIKRSGHPGIGFPVVVNHMPSRWLIQPAKATTISFFTSIGGVSPCENVQHDEKSPSNLLSQQSGNQRLPL
jgi:hypothetical protein